MKYEGIHHPGNDMSIHGQQYLWFNNVEKFFLMILCICAMTSCMLYNIRSNSFKKMKNMLFKAKKIKATSISDLTGIHIKVNLSWIKVLEIYKIHHLFHLLPKTIIVYKKKYFQKKIKTTTCRFFFLHTIYRLDHLYQYYKYN